MNLVLLTEGTGQGVHGRKTNVSRLYDLLIENGNQRINLESGPGTHHFQHLGGTFFGTDARSIVNHHQNWFLNHAPRPDPRPRGVDASGTARGGETVKVFLFGFSRGALIMRVLAKWLGERGVPVEYMGLWDTVDSTVGIRGEDYVELPPNVKFARHAVARDEFRRFFGYLPLKTAPATRDASGTVEELVFPGSHSDVGGLYDDNHAIADVTLDWILEPALERGLKIVPEASRLADSDRRGLKIVPEASRLADNDRRATNPRTSAARGEDASDTVYLVHDSLREPTNGWGAFEPVRRLLDGIRRHPLCERVQFGRI